MRVGAAFGLQDGCFVKELYITKLMKRINLQLSRRWLLLCANLVVFLFLCQSLSAQPLYKKNGSAFLDNSVIHIEETKAYEDLNLSISYWGKFFPEMSVTEVLRLKDLAQNSKRPDFLRDEAEYMPLCVFINDSDSTFTAALDTDTLFIKDGKGRCKVTYLLLKSRRMGVKDVFATVDFRVDLRDLKKNYAKVTFSTKPRNWKRAHRRAKVTLRHPSMRSKYFEHRFGQEM